MPRNKWNINAGRAEEARLRLARNWEEEWKYEACGKTVAVNVKFVADGLGGAVFQSVIENVGKATEVRATP